MTSRKIALYILLSVGGSFGGFMSKLFGATTLSGMWFLFSTAGACLGIYIWYKMGTMY